MSVMTQKQNPIEEIRSFNRFYTSIIGVLDKHIVESRYSLSEARILFEINHSGPCTAREIKNTIKMDEGYLSRIIEKFVNRGIIKRSKSKEDARVYILSLTSKGHQIFASLNSASENEIKKLISTITKKQLGELVKGMQSIREILS